MTLYQVEPVLVGVQLAARLSCLQQVLNLEEVTASATQRQPVEC